MRSESNVDVDVDGDARSPLPSSSGSAGAAAAGGGALSALLRRPAALQHQTHSPRHHETKKGASMHQAESMAMSNRQAAGKHRTGSVAIFLAVFNCCLYVLFFSIANPWTNTGSSTATVAAGAGEFEVAARQSYGFFDDIPAESWNLHRDIYLQSQNHKDPMNPLRGSQFIANVTPAWQSIPATWYQNNYEPNFNCAFEKRIGGINTNGDGPKWVRQFAITTPILRGLFRSLSYSRDSPLMRISFKVCDPHRIKRLALARKARYPDNRGCVVYSIGSNGDFNFELGMQVREKHVTIAPLFGLNGFCVTTSGE